MNSLNSTQRSKVDQLKQIVGTHVPDNAIIDVLKSVRWDTNQGMDKWYNNRYDSKYPLPKSSRVNGSGTKVNEKNIKAYFDQYKDKTGFIEDKMEDFFTAIKVDLADPITLMINYKMGAKTQGKLTYDEFKKGCVELGLDSEQKWYKSIPDLQKTWQQDDKLFENVYNYTFIFSQDEGYKNIDKEVALALWPILLQNKCQFLEKWLKFIEFKDKDKIIKKDQWEMFYTLVKQTDGDLNNFEDDGCWSSQIDSFIEYTQS